MEDEQLGLPDVNELSFEELAAAVAGKDLGNALDFILSSGDNGSEYFGFNSGI